MPRGDDGLVPVERWQIALADEHTLEQIAFRITEGDCLKDVCRSAGWPHSYVLRWINADENRRARYEQAMQDCADGLVQEAMKVAHTMEVGRTVTTNPDGSQKVVEADMLGHRKLLIETNMNIARAWNPERYAPKRSNEETVLVMGLPAEFEQKAVELLRNTLARRAPVLIEQGGDVSEDGFEAQRSMELSAGGIA